MRTPDIPRTDLSDLTVAICERMGIDARYVYRIDLDAARGTATVYCFAGRQGFCKGAKYIVTDDPASPWCGEAALEPPVTIRASL